jgi:hypothetical protein
MKRTFIKCLKLVVLAAAFPFVYGCGPGAGVSSLTGFLFGSGGGLSGGEIALLGGGGASAGGALAGGAGLATLHQPEPATMLLLGGGLMAAAYVRSKLDRHGK